MKNIALLLEYDGSAYSGWQFQPNAISIQEAIETSLSSCYKQPVSIIGAGRTDAGVHAIGQVANFQISHASIPLDKLPEAINSKLPMDIRVLAAAEVNMDFHSRFSAIAREYIYNLSTVYSVFDSRFSTFCKYPIDEKRLFAAAELFIGAHDFTAFSKANPDTKSYFCNVERCEWKKVSESKYQLLIKADRFVYGMVRTIVGAMIDIARGKKELSSVAESFNKNNRVDISPLASANGLILNKIYYPFNIFK